MALGIMDWLNKTIMDPVNEFLGFKGGGTVNPHLEPQRQVRERIQETIDDPNTPKHVREGLKKEIGKVDESIEIMESGGNPRELAIEDALESAIGGYRQVGGPENVSNVSPYTADIMNYIFGQGGTGGLLENLIRQSTTGANLPAGPTLQAPRQMGALSALPGAPGMGAAPTYGRVATPQQQSTPTYGTVGTPQQQSTPTYGTVGTPQGLTNLISRGADIPQAVQSPTMPNAPSVRANMPASPNINTNIAPGDFNAYNAVSMPNAPTPQDPSAAFNAFTSYAPQLQGLVQGATSDYAQQQLGLADMMADDAVQDVLNQYSGQGAYYSGPAMQAAVEAAARPRQEAIANITGQQSQLAGNLLGQGLAEMPRAYQAAGEQAVDIYNIGTNAALGEGTNALTARGQDLDYIRLQQAAAEGNRDAQLTLYNLEQTGALGEAGLLSDIYGQQLNYGANVYGTDVNQALGFGQLGMDEYGIQVGALGDVYQTRVSQQDALNRLASADYQAGLSYGADIFNTKAGQQNVLNRLASGDYQAGLNYGADIYNTKAGQQNVLNRLASADYQAGLNYGADIFNTKAGQQNILNRLASSDYQAGLNYGADIYNTSMTGALGRQGNEIQRFLANTRVMDSFQRNQLDKYGIDVGAALEQNRGSEQLANTALAGVLGYGTPEYYEPHYVYQPGAADYISSLIGNLAPAVGGLL